MGACRRRSIARKEVVGAVLAVLFYATNAFPEVILYESFAGPELDSWMGASVTGGAETHDFNGDGIPDFAVAAPKYDAAGGNGIVYIYHGPVENALTMGYAQTVESEYDPLINFGWAIDGAGRYSSATHDALVMSFNSRASMKALVLSYDNDAHAYERSELSVPACLSYTYFGWSVAGGGDFNGDGVADIVVGNNPLTSSIRGFASVFLGCQESAPDSAPYFIFTGEEAGDRFGYQVDFIPDLDSDGCDELLATAPYSEVSGSAVGKAYLIRGKEVDPTDATPAIPRTLYTLDVGLTSSPVGCGDWACTPESPTVTITGDGTLSGFGLHGVAAGDINGDGTGDLAIATEHQVYVFYLAATMPSILDASTQANRVVTDAKLSTGGTSLGAAGDLDGDGCDDLLIGGPGDDVADYVAVLEGATHSGIALPVAISSLGIMITPDLGGVISDYGSSVSGVGDIDDDGRTEFIVGAPYGNTTGSGNGIAYLYDLMPMAMEAESGTTSIVYAGTPYSSVCLDYNGGGEDLLVTLQGANDSHLFGLDNFAGGVPVFSDKTDLHIAGDMPAGLRGLAVADVNNDGDPDVFVAHESTPQMLLWDDDPMNSGKFVHSSQLLEDPALQTSYTDKSWTGTWADYDNDGWVDLFVGRASGTDDPSTVSAEGGRLLRNVLGEGTVGMVDMTASSGILATNTACVAAAWFDLEGDGDRDLVVGDLRIGGGSRFYENDGDGTFTDSSGMLGTLQGVSGVTPVDVDEDGDEDLVIGRRGASGSNVVLFGNDSGISLSDVTTIFGLDDAQPTNSVLAADLDTDGDIDLLSCPSAGTSVAPRLYRNISTTGVYFEDSFAGSGLTNGAVHGAVVEDWNSDGDYDLYLGRPSTEEFFFQNRAESGTDDPDGLWVAVEVVGGNGNNRYGIGAQVELSVGGQVIGRSVVDGGSGRGGQQSHRIVFGTGESSGTGQVKVTWPDGWETTEAVSVGTASANVTIYDDHPLEKVGTPNCTVTPLPNQRMNVEFTWMTEYSAPALWDEVRIDEGGKGCGVFPTPPESVLDHTVSGVTVAVEKVSGGYLHTLTLWNADCNAPCGFSWKPSSKVQVWDNGAEVIRSWTANVWRTASVPICVQ